MPKVKNSPENFKKCPCNNCPSYNDCMKKNKEKLYCSRGKSKCTVEQNGCICGGCPVHKENKLEGYYFCIKGSE